MKEKMQKLGQSLMQPVAVLPLAALLLGIGYAIDPEGWGANSQFAAFIIKAGGAVLDNLGILFAVGVAFGLAEDKHGAAALAGLVSFLTFTTLLAPEVAAMLKGLDLETWTQDAPFQVAAFEKVNNGNAFYGIISGIIGGKCYNKYHDKILPDFLAFFSGRRLVPIVASLITMICALVALFIWPAIYSGLVKFGETLLSMGAVGAGIYGFFNRLLIPTGLHHALNQVFWFDLVGINDIPNFLGNVQETITATYHPGMYQAGFFPIMMFGLPGAAYAIYKKADKENKTTTKALMLAGALAAFVTGVTEPIEFAFMFLAPQLYLIHAALTAVSLIIVNSLKIYAGFGFSAGLIDLILSIKNPMSAKIGTLILVGLIFGLVYYFIFSAAIEKFDLATPGRTPKKDMGNKKAAGHVESDLSDEELAKEKNVKTSSNYKETAETVLEGLGGKDNIETTSYCATRLRLVVKDMDKVDEEKIKEAQVAGVMKTGDKSIQVIIGTQVQAVYDQFINLLK